MASVRRLKQKIPGALDKTGWLLVENQRLREEITNIRNAEKKLLLDEERLTALLELNQMMKASMQQIIDFSLEKAVRLTQSKYGYLAFADDNEKLFTVYSWTEADPKRPFRVEKPFYSLNQTGFWVEVVNQRKPVMVNHYSEVKFAESGYREASSFLARHLNIPVFDGDRIVAVAGVANKEEDYDDSDIRQLTLLMDGMWKILHRRKAETELANEKELLKVTLESIGDAVIATDIHGRITLLNEVAEKLTGWTRKEAIGKPLDRVVVILNEKTRRYCRNPIQRILSSGASCKLINHAALISRDGKERSIAESGAPIKDQNGKIFGVVLVFRDVTEQRKKENEIRYLSYHDKLTGLYNRAFFEEQIKRWDNEKFLPLSIIIGDANGLKLANDVFGHHEGDRLLQKVARIIKNSCRPADIVARWGGDEFAIIAPNTTEAFGMRICDAIKAGCDQQAEDPIKPSIALGCATKEKPGDNLQQVVKEAEDRMYRQKLLENRSTRSAIIASLKKTLFEKSCETEEHAQRIHQISLKTGQKIGLSANELDDLSLVAILHDMGKIVIEDRILVKPGKLSPEEWKVMRRHPEVGYRIAESCAELSHIAEYILAHHERWDGTGYPQGLKGTEIPRISRIITIVDAFDVMTHSRPYKPAVMSTKEALAEIQRCAGTQFDPELAAVFMTVIEDKNP
ncbi:MAG: diguanylate cyclase [Firmicutes bacterium]|nr:diguanylate cyclase [Bacillota bacterium]